MSRAMLPGLGAAARSRPRYAAVPAGVTSVTGPRAENSPSPPRRRLFVHAPPVRDWRRVTPRALVTSRNRLGPSGSTVFSPELRSRRARPRRASTSRSSVVSAPISTDTWPPAVPQTVPG